MEILDKYSNEITGKLMAFDRMIFKGHIRPFYNNSSKGYFLHEENVLLKDFGTYAKNVTTMIKDNAKQIAKDANRPYIYLDSPKISKEETALKCLKENPIDEGLICVIGTVELCNSLEIKKNINSGLLELVNGTRKCMYLYFYYLDKEFGFMHVKLQTWFPFLIQIYINGREYLAKQLDKEGICYKRHDNCFLQIDDLKRAQEIADKIESKKVGATFDHFAHRVNPFLKRITEIFSQGYFWCLEQCEYATDIMFKSRADLNMIYPDLVDHALTSFILKKM